MPTGVRKHEPRCRAAPAPGAHALLVALHAAGTPVVIVSNNAAEPIRVHLEHYGLAACVCDVVGRPVTRPDLMKPHPHTVRRAMERAMEIAGIGSQDAVLIGDSVSDIEVARAAGVRSIGYAKTQQRGAELSEAGADVVVDSMTCLVQAGDSS